MSTGTIFESQELLPADWRHLADAGALRTFNPGLLRDVSGWIFAYRLVAEPDLLRRIAVCRLDRDFRVIPHSQIALTDHVRFPSHHDYAPEATRWFADPRLYRLGGRLFIYWNSGWHEPGNHQFLQELDTDLLMPVGFPRELKLSGERRKLEKNWSLFDDGSFYAVYSVAPHRVLSFSLAGDGPIYFAESVVVANPAGSALPHGGLRGGAPPQRLGEHYYSFCHSIHDSPDGYRYAASVYRFSADVPFRPTDMPRGPLALANPFGLRRDHAKLNPAVGEVVYPAGAAWDAGKWIVSYGINDERCALATVAHDEVLSSLYALEM